MVLFVVTSAMTMSVVVAALFLLPSMGDEETVRRRRVPPLELSEPLEPPEPLKSESSW